jgi:hypothetical protein
VSRLFRQSRRGSLIVAALLLFSLLLALGMGLMSSQSARMKVAQAQIKAVQARALCEAAWEDVRVKLGKDILFPLPVDGQDFFAYSEDMYSDDDSGNPVVFGSYTVVIELKYDSTARQDDDLSVDTEIAIPQGIYGITCIGKVGKRTEPPEAESEMYYEILMTDKSDLSNSFSVIRVEDHSSL